MTIRSATVCSVAAASPCHGEKDAEYAISAMSWLPLPVDDNRSMLGTSISAAPCADDIRKDKPNKLLSTIRIPKLHVCAGLRPRRYNANPSRRTAQVILHL